MSFFVVFSGHCGATTSIDAISRSGTRTTSDWLQNPGSAWRYLPTYVIAMMTPFLLQPPTMTTIATGPLGFASIAIMFSETFEIPAYSPNGGVRFI
jgi:hypothetical protein